MVTKARSGCRGASSDLAGGASSDLACIRLLTSHSNDEDSLGSFSIEDAFKVFWKAYPKRTPHGNPKKPARKKFEALCKQGVSVDELITGAKNYAAYVEREGTEPQYVAMAQTWLNQERWPDYQADPAAAAPTMTESERDVRGWVVFGNLPPSGDEPSETEIAAFKAKFPDVAEQEQGRPGNGQDQGSTP